MSLSYTSRRQPQDSGLVEYIYPLKTDGKATADAGRVVDQGDRSSRSTPIQNVYSPTHAITVSRHSDKEVTVSFDTRPGLLDKDFQLSTRSATRTSA